MKNSVIPEEVKGSIIEEILLITPDEIEAVRIDLLSQPVEEGDRKFGEMSMLEKKIQALLFKKCYDHDIITDSVQDLLSLSLKNERKIEVIKGDIELLKRLLHVTILNRFGLASDDIAIREGFEIVVPFLGIEDGCVTCNNKDSCHAYQEALHAMLAHGFDQEAN